MRHALRKLRNEKAFERRLGWYEDSVAALAAARDLSIAYAGAKHGACAAHAYVLTMSEGPLKAR